MSFANDLSCHAKLDIGLAPPSCHGMAEPCPDQSSLRGKIKGPIRSIPPVVLGLWVAFFPKCPICWAAYMNVFGIVGATWIPYMGWMYPVLAGMLCVHLLLMLRRSPQTGYLPFALSLGGALTILVGRHYAVFAERILILGILLIAAGSLWSSHCLKSPALTDPALKN
jgi:mercuric ion transport protein